MVPSTNLKRAILLYIPTNPQCPSLRRLAISFRMHELLTTLRSLAYKALTFKKPFSLRSQIYAPASIMASSEGIALKKVKYVSVKITSTLYAVMIEFIANMYAFSL